MIKAVQHWAAFFMWFKIYLCRISISYAKSSEVSTKPSFLLTLNTKY
jgi:hypothetical protein